MGMNSKGRSTGSNDDEDERSADTDPEPGRASSGVFRASRREPRLTGGWTIAEQFVRGGYYYRLLRRPVTAADSLPRLTKREEAALELASAGHGNKDIAQALSVSPSTVGVLLFRAASKLNVSSRSDLLLAFQALKTIGVPPTDPDED
jgi:DNA-binding CsgD family transcriptional regulator